MLLIKLAWLRAVNLAVRFSWTKASAFRAFKGAKPA